MHLIKKQLINFIKVVKKNVCLRPDYFPGFCKASSTLSRDSRVSFILILAGNSGIDILVNLKFLAEFWLFFSLFDVFFQSQLYFLEDIVVQFFRIYIYVKYLCLLSVS